MSILGAKNLAERNDLNEIEEKLKELKQIRQE